MLFKRYILIFTLALISCAGTNYIQSMTTSNNLSNTEIENQDVNNATKKCLAGEDINIATNHLI